ncbi:MAG: NAD(P)/FAD-dependent oxidoreductase [Actinomycetales bacterium]|jgi:predicted NAD/FAD-binding protein
MAEYVTGQRERRRVAVVGSGVAGLTAAHVFGSAGRHVTLYEADHRLGGHADTHLVNVAGRIVAVDTGFIVHNDRTYPTLLRLFDELGVETRDSDMSMSIRVDALGRRGIEYAGALGARGLFPSVRNVLDLGYLRMLTEVKRFHRHATAILASPVDPEGDEETLRAFVARVGLSEYFTTRFLRPLVAAVWSCDPARALDYPARYLFAFLDHHGMLTVFGSPTWRTVVGGSRCYVEKVAAGLDEVRVGRAVTGVVETDDAVWVTDAAGDTHAYDAVVLAGHPHQSLAMLTRPSAAQREVLGAMTYTTNHAQLHTDESVLPTRRAARASWNYWERPDDDRDPVLVTYDISRLMGIDEPDRRFLVTLGGEDRVDPATVIDTMTYEHPLYTPETLAAQRKLPSITTPRIAFAGAYHGWGFHEDGALSGVVAARHLGVEWATVADREAAVAVAS